MRKKKDYTMGTIGNLYFIHHANPSDFPRANDVLTTNETGAFLWNHLETDLSLEELAECLADYYEAEPDMVKADVTEFLAGLRQIGAIEE